MFHEFMLGEVIKMVNGKAPMLRQELVRGVSINSQAVKPGDLFFALKGSRTDGHNFVADALHRGALAAVVEDNCPTLEAIRVRDTLFALGELARNYRSHFRTKTIGITGTNGKTTVKNLIMVILSRHNRVVATNRNFNSLIGLPLTILRISGEEDYLIVEMGTNAPGEIKRLCDIAQPDIGVITNVGPGHLAGLSSIDGIRKEKMALIDALPPEGIGLVGEGVDFSARRNITKFSADMLETIDITEYGSHFSFQNKAFSTQLLGIGNVYNCLAAICLASRMGIDYETQRSAIAAARPEPGRMEPIRMDGLLVINDTYNANPVSMRAAIDFAAQSGRKTILVLGDMLELGTYSEDLHREVGVYAQKHCDALLTHGSEAKLYGGRHFPEQSDLLRYLTETIRGDELVLLKASRALRFERIVNALGRLMR